MGTKHHAKALAIIVGKVFTQSVGQSLGDDASSVVKNVFNM